MNQVMIEELQPMEEPEGTAYARGNRSLIHFNLSYNLIRDPQVIREWETVNESNPIIEHVSIFTIIAYISRSFWQEILR